MLRRTTDIIQEQLFKEGNMNATKQDLTCPFHPDLEAWLIRIESKVDCTNNKISKLLLWRSYIIGYASGATVITVMILKWIKFI